MRRAVSEESVEPHLEPVRRQRLGDALTPLDDRHGVVDRRIEVEVVQLRQSAEAISVSMDEGRSARPRSDARARSRTSVT